MDASRIDELTSEYEEELERDIEIAREVLKPYYAKQDDDYYYRAAFPEDGDVNLYMLHCLLETAEVVCRDGNEALIDEIGRQGRHRLFWAFQHEDDYYDRYMDRTYELPAGDYIITDPCYLMEGASHLRWDEDVWNGEELSCWGIPTSFMRDTIFGDWSCSLIDEGTGLSTGEFCADAGLVVVADYNEVLAVNPSFAQWVEEHSWCATIIRDFEGTLTYEVMEAPYEYEGEMHEDYELQLVFDGKNAMTSEPMRLLGGMFSE